MVELAKLGALALVGAVFVYALHRDWDGVFLLFGIVFLLGSCQLIGVQ